VSYYILKYLIPQLQLFITDIGYKYIALPVYSEAKAQGKCPNNRAISNNALTTGHYQNIALNTR